METVRLKKDWDLPPHHSIERGHFLGRTEELDRLVADIVRREGGTILISGARGVGKTALVYKALRRSAKELNNQKIKLVPVFLNASQLEVGVGSQEQGLLRLHIIKNLIRRLYAGLKAQNISTRGKVDDLYKKAVAAEVEIKTSLETDSETGQSTATKKKFTIPQTELKTLVIGLAVFISSIFGLVRPIPARFSDALNTLLSMLFLFPAPLAILFSWERISEKTRAKRTKESASEFYKHDASLSNLEFDLESALANLIKEKPSKKIVFVIDELDKIRKSTEVIQMIEAFKNLFNLSPAIFVFISGPELFDEISKQARDRGPEYTLFTNRIFLPRPAFADIQEFIADIIESAAERDLNALFHYLCFVSKSDFFDLYSLINDLAIIRENEQELIIDFSDQQTLFANLQRALGLIFPLHKRTRPSDWRQNEDLLSAMYGFLNSFAYQGAGYEFEVNKPSTEFIGLAIDSMVELLYRLKVIEFVREEAREEDVFIVFRFTGKCLPPPAAVAELLPYETAFVESFSTLHEEIRGIGNILSGKKGTALPKKLSEAEMARANNLGGIDSQGIYDENYKVLKGLRKRSPEHFLEENLSERSSNINAYLFSLRDAKATVFENLLKELYPDFVDSVLQNDPALFSIAGNLRDKLISGEIWHRIIARPDRSKQVLLIKDMAQEVLEENRNVLKNADKIHRIINFASGNTVYDLRRNDRSFLRIVPVGEDIKLMEEEISRLREWFASEAVADEAELANS